MTSPASAYDQALQNLVEYYSRSEYWEGSTQAGGYTQGGYADFAVNAIKAQRILESKPHRVLEVGCAMGFIVQRLRAAGVDARGVDISSYAISKAPPDVREYLSLAFGHELKDFPDGSQDLIVSFGMMEHLPEDLVDATLAEFKRVAKRAVLSITLSTDFNGLSIGDHPSSHDRAWWRHKIEHYFAPGDYDLWSDAVETWDGWASKQVLIIAPGITPVSPHTRYGGIEKLVALFARGLQGISQGVSLIAPTGSHAPAGAELIDGGPAIGDFHEPGIAGAFSRWFYQHSPGGHDDTGVGHYARCILDFTHSHPVWTDVLPSLSFAWHDPALMQPKLPKHNLCALSVWQQERLLRYQKHESRVVDPHVYDDSFFTPGDPSQVQQDRFLYIGKLHPYKGALDAILLAKMAGVRLDILGPQTGGDPQEYIDAVLAECDGDQVSYYPSVSAEGKRELFRRSAALIYPVSYPKGTGEAHSHKMAEAIGAGVPCIALDQGAMNEVITPGVTGFIAKTRGEFLDCMKHAGELDRKRVAEEGWQRWSVPATMQRFGPVIRDINQGERW